MLTQKDTDACMHNWMGTRTHICTCTCTRTHTHKPTPKHTSPQGILVFCLTRAPAATMACFSTIDPSSKVAPIPTKASSSTVQPCKTALWPAWFEILNSNTKNFRQKLKQGIWHASDRKHSHVTHLQWRCPQW